jgi:hypothetical protein
VVNQQLTGINADGQMPLTFQVGKDLDSLIKVAFALK